MKCIFFSLILIVSTLFFSCNRGAVYSVNDQGIEAMIDSTLIEVQYLSPDIVRVLKSRMGHDYEKVSLSVIKELENVEFEIAKEEGRLTLSSGSLDVILNLQNGSVSFNKTDGARLLAESDHGSVFSTKMDANKPSFSVKQNFKLDSKEYIYGLGQLQNGKMSQRNQTVRLIQDNKETVIPFIISNKGYGLFWDNYSPTIFSDNPDTTSFDSEVGDCIDYYVMLGDNADGVITQMRDLTGQVPMFPYWTFGYWQSKERYKSQDETVGVVKKYRELGVPLDGIIQDWQYWGDNYHWNAMAFLNPDFPDPQKMVDQVHDLNAHIIISIWASFGPKTRQYEVMDKNGMLLDFTTWPVRAVNTWPEKPGDPLSGVKVYDAYNPEARDIYWDYLKKGIFSLGMDGWWMDSTEPDHLNIKDEDYNDMTYLGSLRSVKNAFPLMTVGGVSSHQKAELKDKRVFILTRSAFAGQQRYGANSWSGDVVTDWDVLRKQISSGLNFSLCGIPYWNSDIGGFFTWNYPGGVNNKAYHEIYVRWLQFGAFCPMMRSHGTDTPREIWNFGKKGDWAYDAIEKFINLRYSLLPYIYSTSWDVTSNGSSMMRALLMDFPDDPDALDIDNEFMFGKSILVAPVTKPMYVKAEKERGRYINAVEDFAKMGTTDVYLPYGTEWYDFWTGEKLKGGQTVQKETPIDIIPLYVKAGSIIPFGPQVQFANEEIGPLTIRIYPGVDGSSVFYDDERDSYDYEDGEYAIISFQWDESTHTLTIGSEDGDFPNRPKSREIDIVKVSQYTGIGLPFNDKVTKKVTYRGSEIQVKL